ncbi:hypothetical protein [Aulosira sp. FACHB-615]|uniref:hypothetical protein n=1 Tax=Aulosira sp. FACHB-615 TaxID=2692777 RepID=UPI00168820C5|nr:hypothetical protein [Aulosira sp. FACHB-615]MBD2492473.1 hypothetical protein [Aulosira sp. FACHB-615]
MPSPVSVLESRLGINQVLTNLAQGYKQPDFVMRLLFPLADVSTYGGQIIQFDEAAYEDVTDDRADGAPYPEVQSGYSGVPFKLAFKGLTYKVPDKRRNEMANMKINWGAMATNVLMSKAGLRHEIESAAIATTAANYATNNVVTLSSGTQLNESGVDPDPVIRTGITAVGNQIGVEPNVMLIGVSAFDALATKYARNFTSTNTTPGLRQQLTEDTLAQIFGFARCRKVKALKKVGATKSRVMDKDIVLAYTNPAALNSDRLPYRPMGNIDVNMLEPSYGYTYVYVNNPLMYDPGRNEENKYTYYQLDFDRKVVATGVQESDSKIISGYLIKNAVA